MSYKCFVAITKDSRKSALSLFLIYPTLFFTFGCRKLVEIPPPASTITAGQVYSSDDLANSGVVDIYADMINTNFFGFGSGAFTFYCGMSADELIPFNQQTSQGYIQYQQNNLTGYTAAVGSSFWQQPYSILYKANVALEQLSLATGVHDSVKRELIGEAKFVRAFCNFYLTNLFGDIPLVNTSNWQKTNLLARSPSLQIYEEVINDLKDAQINLATDYSFGNGERIRPNKWAAAALMARVYLYEQQWALAIAEADSVISNNLYKLDIPANVFLANSNEAIWQLQLNNTVFPYGATEEGLYLIPQDSSSAPICYFTSQLISSFDSGDLRKKNWIDSTNYEGVTYYYPYKYKVHFNLANDPITEYYMVLRLAEQYLIRAEAEAHLGENDAAVTDLNVIRKRAGLPVYAGQTDQVSLLTEVTHQRQLELFAEWGHRWFDLKREGTDFATAALSASKGFSINSNALLYPIPIGELQVDPNLRQNVGY